jgi:hypothetical protein
MSFTTRRNNSGVRSSSTANPFCKVCYDAGLSTEEYTSHFVKDQPGPNGKVVCPTLLAQKCLICGVPGHTSSYCPDNSSVSSSSSSTVKKETRFKMATDEIRYPPHSIRLPPIQKQQQQQQQPPLYRPAPRIVYADELFTKPVVDAHREFPSLSKARRFENDEPKHDLPMAAAASPVHSPAVKYNKKNNPFGALDNNVDSDVDNDVRTLPVVQKLPSSSSSSWASIAAASKSTVVAAPKQPQQQQRARSRFSIVVPTAISAGPLLPPVSFKPKPVSASDLEKKQQVKKLWGDTDSEDDGEFLKRGVN